MELNNNASFAASQPYRCTCQRAPPTYESTSNSQSRSILPEHHANTQLPPPYSALDTESYVSDWVEHDSRIFWVRSIKRRGKTWYQYSIERNETFPWAGNGTAFFTCGRMAREGHSEESIREICESTAMLLEAHRHDCSTCTVHHIQTGGRTCAQGMSGHHLRYSMTRHNVACSCKCFDVQVPPRQVLSTPVASGCTLQGIGEYHHRSLDPLWESEVQQGQFYWFRTIQRGGKPRFQCGINRRRGLRRYDEEPDLLFTCKMMPRAGYSKGRVMEDCKSVALALKTHRVAGSENCSVCEFRHVQGKRIGCPASIFSQSRAQLLHNMRRHDEACSCRCFHIDMHGRPTIENTTRPSRPHNQTGSPVARQVPKAIEDRPDREWESAPGMFFPKHFYWTRTLKNGDDIWHQHGISKRPSDDGPEFFFTCKLKPRRKGNEPAILKLCKELASHMRAHRSANYNRCTCNFQTWRIRGGSGGCRVSWYHLNTRVNRYLIGALMQRHDVLCSCGCFDVEINKDAARSDQD